MSGASAASIPASVAVDLGEDCWRCAGRHRGLPCLTPRLLDLGQTTQRVLQERRSPREGPEPCARLKVSLLPESLL